jgi:environmental stress-induced protein Ves
MAGFTILRARDYKKLPWKNGLGETLEIAIHPPERDFASGDFAFRLSCAHVTRPSEFSLFPQHDRILILKDGAGLRLSAGGAENILASSIASRFPLDLAPHVPFSFSGALALRSELLRGPITDFNVFTSRDSMSASVVVRALDASLAWVPNGRWAFAFALEGVFRVDGATHGQANEQALLRDGDTLRFDSEGGNADFRDIVLAPAEESQLAKVALVEIFERQGQG